MEPEEVAEAFDILESSGHLESATSCRKCSGPSGSVSYFDTYGARTIGPLLYFFSIDQHMPGYTGQLQRDAVYNDDISVFSFLEGTDTVCDTDVFCRVDGYGPERICIHPFRP